jgi:hypothetical protein
MSDQDFPKSEADQLLVSAAVLTALNSSGHLLATGRAMQDVINTHASFDVNEELVHEQFARHNRGEHLDLTINQEQALLIAWLDRRRYQQIAEMRRLSNVEVVRRVLARYGLMEIYPDRPTVWVWQQDKAEGHGWPIIQKIFDEIQALRTPVQGIKHDAGNSSRV